MDEKVKHRIVGAFVLIALIAIFIPLAFKNHQHDKSHTQKNVFYIPPPPVKQKLAMPDFKPLPVAHVDLDKPAAAPTSPVTAELKPQAKVTPVVKRTVSKRVVAQPPKVWVVQLASFADKKNAKNLARSLQKKGFAAYTSSQKNSKGIRLSRVFVGPEIKRQQALSLQTRLVTLTKIKGIVVAFDPRARRHEL